MSHEENLSKNKMQVAILCMYCMYLMKKNHPKQPDITRKRNHALHLITGCPKLCS